MMQERQRPPMAGNPGVMARGWIVASLVVACITSSPAAGDGWIMADAVNGSAVCPAQSNSSGIFLDACASPSPRTQLWRIDERKASFASLAFFPEEKVLGMTVTAGRLSWRDAVLLGGPGDGKYYRSVMSLVSPVPALDAKSVSLPVRGNLVSNGGFERCSYDVTEASLAVTLSTEEFFGPCFWNIRDGRVQIFGPGREIVEGNLALALGGVLFPGAFLRHLARSRSGITC